MVFIETNYKVDIDLLNYLMESIKTTVECDIEEKVHNFPYTRCVNDFFKKLKTKYDIDFNKDLISEKLLDLMVDEIIHSLPR